MNPEKEFTITTESLGVCGAVAYWRASGEVSIKDITTAWNAAGLDPKLLRKVPEPETALRRAVQAQQDRHRLVRALSKKSEWAIVDETVVEGQAPTYTTLALVRFEDGHGPAMEAVDGNNADIAALRAAIYDGYVRQQGTFQPEDITSWLVKLAYGANAVTLRDSGGVYFIPKPAMDFWNKVSGVIETVSRNAHRVFRIPAMKNSEAIEAIVDAVTMEAEQLANIINDEINAGLGDRALETRRTNVMALIAKVASYEELVGQQIKVRDRLESIQAAVATAQLIASAPNEEAA